MLEAPMKKPRRPFTVEVKRSRRPSRERSVFQPSAIETDRLSLVKPSSLWAFAGEDATVGSALPLEQRTVPDLSGETI
jgi:hypothetical protein